MSKTVRLLGSVVFAAFMYAVPVLLACAFCLDWDSFAAYLLTIVALAQFTSLIGIVYDRAEEDE